MSNQLTKENIDSYLNIHKVVESKIHELVIEMEEKEKRQLRELQEKYSSQ